jgi:hypothetical protein
MFKKFKSLFIKDKIQVESKPEIKIFEEKNIVSNKIEKESILEPDLPVIVENETNKEVVTEEEITELTQQEIQDFIQEDIDFGKYMIDNTNWSNDYIGTSFDIDILERDSLFLESAKIIVNAQEGSASLIQRKLKLGYNRAGRIIDQLEAAGIIGSFQESKSRNVNFSNLEELNKYLNNTENISNNIDIKTKSDNNFDKIFSKRKLFDDKYRETYIEFINTTIEEYKIEKENEEEKEKIKQKYLERERKKLLREQAKQELINEGLINVNIKTSSEERKITQKVKDMVWNRDQGKCIECGSNEKLEFDHIIPFSKGGSNTYRNIQLLCEKCNREKSNKIG